MARRHRPMSSNEDSDGHWPVISDEIVLALFVFERAESRITRWQKGQKLSAVLFLDMPKCGKSVHLPWTP